MTTDLKPSEASLPYRIICAVLTLAALLAAGLYFAAASRSVQTVRLARPTALIALAKTDQTAGVARIPEDVVRTAMAAKPLDPGMLNVAMVRAVRQSGLDRAPTWLKTVDKMGWRDTRSLQNRLYVAALTNNVPAVLDLCDALLRRQQLQDEIIPALSVAELDPKVRNQLVARLAAGPIWRPAYLASTSHLDRPVELRARAWLLEELARRGAAASRAEAVPNVAAFERQGLPDLGFKLWRRIQPGVASPLDDVEFDRAAAKSQDAGEAGIPFEWQLAAGTGYSVDAYDEAGEASLNIDWDGRGVPLLAQQRTSATPGNYTLKVAKLGESARDLSGLAFRLVCGNTAVNLEPVAGRPTEFRSARRISCFYPVLQISGNLQASISPRHLAIGRLELVRRPDRG